MKALAAAVVISVSALAAAQNAPYFQQQVNYNIKADLDPKTARIAGSERIDYYNNSPDTLREIYFHLYFNAFQPGSYLDRQEQSSGEYWLAYINPRDMGYVRIDLLRNAGAEIKNYQIDNTVMKVPLAAPLAPGDSTYFYIEFTSQVPTRGNRTAHSAQRFDIGQWYPKPAVYDRYGWHDNQYLSDSEFFSEWGNYYVELTLPDDYIVAHTGQLLNETEIFGGPLPAPEGDSIITNALKYIIKDSLSVKEDTLAAITENSPTEKIKTWKMHADSVHDFSFCASPDYLVDIARYNNTIIKCYYTAPESSKWAQYGAECSRKSIKLFSEIYYPYPYGQFSTVASIVSGGMEYPQLVMVSNKYSAGDNHDLEATIAHEVGHNWFYGILAFNETEQAFLDEGLTSLATTQYLEYYYGRFHNNFSYKKKWQRKLLPNGNDRNDNQKQYIGKALRGAEDPMNTPASLFKDGWRYYNASYYKASSVYFMLQYAIGDGNFKKFLSLLFDLWAYKHPYLSDVQAIAEEVSGQDLEWFFRQWFSTTWTLDYALDGLHAEKAEGDSAGYHVTLQIKNEQRCISPLDIALYYNDRSADTVHIPVTVWIDGQRQFDTTIFVSARPKGAAVNPDLRLADIDRLNNSTGLPPMHFQFMAPRFIYHENYIENYTSAYTVAHNPTLWYNAVDGAKIGYEFRGSYLGENRIFHGETAFGALNQSVNYSFRYEDPLVSFGPTLSYYLGSREWEGRGRQEIGVHFAPESDEAPNAAYADLALERYYLFDRNYLFDDGWSPGAAGSLDLTLIQNIRRQYFNLSLQGSLSSSVPGSDYDFSRVAAGMRLTISGIGFGETAFQFKAGSASGNLPLQRRFYLSSADPLDTWQSPLYRSRGTLPDQWKRDGHLFKPGGAGLAGYLQEGITGNRLLALTVSNDIPPLRLPVRIPYVSRQIGRIRSEIYLAGGYVWDDSSKFDLNKMLWESGLVLSYNIPGLNLILSESRLSLHLPLWLSDPPSGEDNLEWRWLFSFTP